MAKEKKRVKSGFVKEGSSAPLGATVYPGGVNFSVFSKNASLIELLLFDDKNSARPEKIIPLDPLGIAPITTGMSSSRPSKRGRFMATAPMGRSSRSAVFGSMARRFCSTLMVLP